MSLLLANGHPNAPFYPVGRVWDEVALVEERVKTLEATRAILLELAVSSPHSKRARGALRKILKEMVNGEA